MLERATSTRNLRSQASARNRPSADTEPVCLCGAAAVDITPKKPVAMAGYATDGKVGRPATDRLFARAVYFERGDERLAWCVVDLWSATGYLLARVSKKLSDIGLGMDRIILSGTHTHTAPGRVAGNGLYDTFGQCEPGFSKKLAKRMAKRIARAIRTAHDNKRPARVALQRDTVWGLSRNRSLKPFLASFADVPDPLAAWQAPGWPGHGPAAGLSPQQQAIDPRLTLLTAVRDEPSRRIIASFALFGCHATALGSQAEEMSRDWPGHTVDHVQAALGRAGHDGVVVAFAQTSAGDVTPLPPDDRSHWDGPAPPDVEHPELEHFQGPALATWVGNELAARWLASVRGAGAVAEPFALQAAFGIWEPLAASARGTARKISSWNVGWPLIAGAEDMRSTFFRLGLAFEGMTSDFFDDDDRDRNQLPKRPFLGRMQGLLQRLCRSVAPARWHPLHVARIGDLVLATVPGEPTCKLAHGIEQALLQKLTGSDAPDCVSVLGYSGDYAGYFVTAEEYALQHYEGAHTLYGSSSDSVLRSQLLELVEAMRTSQAPALPDKLEVLTLGATAAKLLWRAACAGLPNTERAELVRKDDAGAVAVVASGQDLDAHPRAAGHRRVTLGSRGGPEETVDAIPLAPGMGGADHTVWLARVGRPVDGLEISVGDEKISASSAADQD